MEFTRLICPGKFTETSDVDIAIDEVNPEYFFSVIGLLSTELGREVDLIELRKYHFACRIRQQGVLWK
jgi:predicted nucleotidyltransferase